MNKRNILVITLVSIFHLNYAMDSQNLPSKNEILATGHPLTIVLGAQWLKYKENPQSPQGLPVDECLNVHNLLGLPWIHEKGFTQNMVQAYKANKTQAEITQGIEDNKSFQAVPEITQKLLRNNLLLALDDCSRNAKVIEKKNL